MSISQTGSDLICCSQTAHFSVSTCSAKTDLAPPSLHGERHQTQLDGEWCRREAGMKTVVAVMMFLTCCSDGGLASAGCMTGGSLQVSEGVSGRLFLDLSTRKEDVRVRCCKCAVALPELCGRRQRDGVTKRSASRVLPLRAFHSSRFHKQQKALALPPFSSNFSCSTTHFHQQPATQKQKPVASIPPAASDTQQLQTLP